MATSRVTSTLVDTAPMMTGTRPRHFLHGEFREGFAFFKGQRGNSPVAPREQAVHADSMSQLMRLAQAA
ncbi:MAG: hypothetical protein ACLR7Z_16050 [Bilophila wadsworthia]